MRIMLLSLFGWLLKKTTTSHRYFHQVCQVCSRFFDEKNKVYVDMNMNINIHTYV